MDVSRIEILTSLPEPHFDDEATIVTARQVVPLAIAKTSDRRRQTVILLSLLVAAALFGALVALAVNHFEQRESVSSAIRPATTTTSAHAPQPSSTVATSEVESPSGGSAAGISSSNAEDTASAASSSGEKVEPQTKADESIAERKKATSAEPRQLVRPRRVHRPKDQTTPARKGEPGRGAARIQDIFTGSNP
jgi:ABC-type Na+ efflux pump permease subunit